MSTEDDTAGGGEDAFTAARRLHEAADAAVLVANGARALAVAIDRRRAAVVSRDDELIVRHCAAVWSSGAATASRLVLQIEVEGRLDRAAGELTETRLALESLAGDLEHQARAARRDAAVRESG